MPTQKQKQRIASERLLKIMKEQVVPLIEQQNIGNQQFKIGCEACGTQTIITVEVVLPENQTWDDCHVVH